MLIQAWNQFKKYSSVLTQIRRRKRWQRYSLPLILVLIHGIFKFILQIVIPEPASYHLLVLIVLISSWYGGLGPGLIAVFLESIFNIMFFYPFTEPNSFLYILLSTVIFIVIGVIISMISEAKYQSDIQKDEFIAIVSHELKNPLTTINTLAQLLKTKYLSHEKKGQDYLNKIEVQVKNIVALINDLQDLTKLESRNLVYHKKQFPLYSLVRETVADEQLITKSHRLILEGKTKKIVSADEVRLRQVLINLITNAVKYSPNSDKVLINIKNVPKGVIIEVKDYGIGIENDQLKKIFERFYRTTQARDSSASGLGLGLHIASQIIKNHRGRLWATSSSGKGATFHLFIPAH